MPARRQLWAPWRSPYIEAIRPQGGRRLRCIFCAAARSRADRAAWVVHRGRRVFCLLNRYPYNNGHLMISPYRHVGALARLTRAEQAELLETASQMMARLQRALQPHGFNLGINLGRIAGAGIPGHLHLHVVPRWHGDTNFMPIIGQTKIISQSLQALYERLAPDAV